MLRMVAEGKRTGTRVARWRDIDINSASIGIEIVSPGMNSAIARFPPSRSPRCFRSSRRSGRYEITRSNIVGHLDIAPTRKRDPSGNCSHGMNSRAASPAAADERT